MRTGWGKIIALVSAACFGVAMPLAKIAFGHGTNALTLMTLRYFVLAVVLGVWLLASGNSFAMAPRTLAASVAIGVTFVGTAGGALAAIVYMPVSLAVLVFYTYPTITLLAECALERRRPHRVEVLAVALALVGLLLTLQASLDDLNFTGVGFALIASFSAASALIISGHTLQRAGMRLVGFYSCAVAFAICGVITSGLDAMSIPDTRIGLWLLAVVIVAFSVAVVTMFASLQRIGPSRAATLFCFEPVVGIFTAILLLGERLEPQQWLGAALVGVAILIATKRQPDTKEL